MTAPASTDPVTNRRERNRARRHEAIAAAALELFTEQGYEGTTVEDIAMRADVSMRTFFRYFATKDQTVFNDILPATGAISQRISTRPSSEHPWTKLRTSYCAIAREHTTDDIHRIKTRYRLIRSTPALLARHAELNRREQLEVVRALRSSASPTAEARELTDGGFRDGRFSDDELRLLVSVAYTTIWHAVDRWAADERSGDLAPALESAFQMLPNVLFASLPAPCSHGANGSNGSHSSTPPTPIP